MFALCPWLSFGRGRAQTCSIFAEAEQTHLSGLGPRMCPGVVNARRPASLPRQQAAAPVVTGPCSPARGGGWFGFWGVITVAAACFDAERAPLGHGLTSRAVCPGPALLPWRPGFADLSQGRGGEASSFPSGHGHSRGTRCADGPRGLALAKAEDPARPRSHRQPCTWTGQGRPWALCPHGGCCCLRAPSPCSPAAPLV